MKNKIRSVIFVICISIYIRQTSGSIVDQSTEDTKEKSQPSFDGINNNILDAINQLRVQINDLFEKVERKLEILESKVASTDIKASNTEVKIGSMETKLGSLETNVDYIKANVELINTEVKNIGSINSNVLSLEPKVRNTQKEIEGIKVTVSNTDVKIGNLETKMKSMDIKIGNVETNMNYIKVNEEFINSRLKNITLNTESINSNVLSFEAKIKNTQREIESTKILVDKLISLPNSLEKHLQNYKMTDKQLIHSLDSPTPTTSYPLLVGILKNLYFNVATSSMEFLSCYKTNRILNTSQNGVYELYPYQDKENSTEKSVNAFCDMKSDGGGWTVFQRRGIPGNLTETDRSDLFNKTWNEYKNGFGDPNYDYWLGLESIHQLTKDCNHELLITATHLNGSFYLAHYSTFSISSEENKFKLTVGDYIEGNSTLQDSLKYHNGRSFSTIDRDNDSDSGSCSAYYKANGFWFKNCFQVSLNGVYPSSLHPETMSADGTLGIIWSPDMKLKLKRTEMKIRPKC